MFARYCRLYNIDRPIEQDEVPIVAVPHVSENVKLRQRKTILHER